MLRMLIKSQTSELSFGIFLLCLGGKTKEVTGITKISKGQLEDLIHCFQEMTIIMTSQRKEKFRWQKAFRCGQQMGTMDMDAIFTRIATSERAHSPETITLTPIPIP
ncbi:hypothetical protein STEG23_012994, partial [Scotinomys teguina]